MRGLIECKECGRPFDTNEIHDFRRICLACRVPGSQLLMEAVYDSDIERWYLDRFLEEGERAAYYEDHGELHMDGEEFAYWFA